LSRSLAPASNCGLAKNNNTQQEVLANDFVYFLMSEKHEFLYLKLENLCFTSREARPKLQFSYRIENTRVGATKVGLKNLSKKVLMLTRQRHGE